MDSADESVDRTIAHLCDPFAEKSESERAECVEGLCERVKSDASLVSLALQLLAHRMSSPNGAEALLALNTLDSLVQKCDLENEINKTTEQFVRLLSVQPKNTEFTERFAQILAKWKSAFREPHHVDQLHKLASSEVKPLQRQEVRFDPETTRGELERRRRDQTSSAVQRKPTPHARVSGLHLTEDCLKMFAASSSAALDVDHRQSAKSPGGSSMTDDFESLSFSNGPSPRVLTSSERRKPIALYRGFVFNWKYERKILGGHFFQCVNQPKKCPAILVTDSVVPDCEVNIIEEKHAHSCKSGAIGRCRKVTKRSDRHIPTQSETSSIWPILKPGLFTDKSSALLDSIVVSLNDVEILAKEPVVFFDDKTLKGLLYRVRPANSDVIILLATLVFTNTHPIDNLQLHFSTTSNGYRNVNPKMYNIGAFSPLRPVVKLNQLLLLGPLTGDIEKIDLEYSLLSSQFTFVGATSVQMK